MEINLNLESEDCAKINKSEIAYDQIKAMIVSGNIKQGAPIKEMELSKLLGLSRTPIREALRLLETENFVHSTPNKGVCAAKLSSVDASEILEARIGIETYAAKLCIGKPDSLVLETLKKSVEAQEEMVKRYDYLSFALYDKMFHRTIVEGSKNSRLIAFWNTLMDHTQMIMNVVFSTKHNIALSVNVHKELLQLIEDGNETMACSLLHEHIGSMREDIARILLLTDTAGQ